MELAIYVPAKLKMIGDDEIGEAFAIALYLGRALRATKRVPDVLCLDVTDRAHTPRDNKVRSTAGDPFRFVRCDDITIDGLNERLQRRTIGVLGCVPLLTNCADRPEIVFCGRQCPPPRSIPS